MQVDPAAQLVGPVHPVPPHCPHLSRNFVSGWLKSRLDITYFGAVGPPEEALVVVGTTTTGVVVAELTATVVVVVLDDRVVAGLVVSTIGVEERVEVVRLRVVVIIRVVYNSSQIGIPDCTDCEWLLNSPGQQ